MMQPAKLFLKEVNMLGIYHHPHLGLQSLHLQLGHWAFHCAHLPLHVVISQRWQRCVLAPVSLWSNGLWSNNSPPPLQQQLHPKAGAQLMPGGARGKMNCFPGQGIAPERACSPWAPPTNCPPGGSWRLGLPDLLVGHCSIRG